MKNKNKIIIRKETFAVVKSKKVESKAFAIIKDRDEITNIIDQDKINNKEIIEINKDWKLITFDTILDFGLVGFIAKISSALAKAKISIFVISSYSTDHLLVKNKDLDKTIKILEDPGYSK